ELVSVLALRRRPRLDAVAPRHVHPALRKRVRGVRDRIRVDDRRGAARSDPDRRLLQRQRARQPAPRAGDGVRDVHRARGDDGAVHPAAAAVGQVGEVTLRRPRMSVSAMVWLLLTALYFLVPLIATFLFSLRKVTTNACCSLAAYGF